MLKVQISPGLKKWVTRVLDQNMGLMYKIGYQIISKYLVYQTCHIL